MTMEATIVIATRDRAQLLRGCLAALRAQSLAGRFEIIVVDNGSSDATAATVDEFGARRIFVAAPNRAKARNAGIALAAAPIVIFCDDDTVAPPSFVEAHLRVHAARPNRVVTGPIINVSDPADQPRPRAQHFSRAFFCTCNVSAPIAAVRAVAGFDERYDLYGWEDMDLGLRLRARGLRRSWSWDAYIYHIKSAEATTLERRVAQAREKGRMAARFVRKAPSWPVRLATGAYAVNFARAALLNARPLRAVYERVAKNSRLRDSPLAGWAQNRVADAAYVVELRAGLREPATPESQALAGRALEQ